MTATDMPAAPTTARPLALRIVVVLIALIETLATANDFSAIFEDYGHTAPLVIFAQRLGNANLALAPFMAGAALILAAIGRVRAAIIVFAAHLLLAWLTDLPGIAIHGLELTPDYGGAYAFCARFIYPLIAAIALILAWRNQRLWLAASLIALPLIANWLGVLAFALAVSIYGF